MVIKKLSDIPFAGVQGYDRVKKQIVIGPEDGSQEIVLRYFSIESGGMSPHHAHEFHLVKIESGRGAVMDASGKEHFAATRRLYLYRSQRGPSLSKYGIGTF